MPSSSELDGLLQEAGDHADFLDRERGHGIGIAKEVRGLGSGAGREPADDLGHDAQIDLGRAFLGGTDVAKHHARRFFDLADPGKAALDLAELAVEDVFGLFQPPAQDATERRAQKTGIA